jgi:hypothetical protein
VVEPARTNMVYAGTTGGLTTEDLAARLAARGLLCAGAGRLRFVFHLGVSRTDAAEAARIVRETVAS